MTEQTRRATRLMRIRDVLGRRGSVSCAELADELGYSQRTIQRDIAALESELGVPLTYEGRRWKLMEGAKLVFGPVRLTLQEARALYFATRLMLRSADERDPDGISALEKVAFGGPHHYTGLDMRKGHERLVKMGLTDRHFDAVLDHLGNTLRELGVAEPLVKQVNDIAESTRTDVLGR